LTDLPSGFPYPLLNWNVNFDSAFELGRFFPHSR